MYSNIPKTRKCALEINSRHYYTGNPCNRGHFCLRLSCNSKCLECSKVNCKKYAESNKQKQIDRYKKYRENNKVKIAASIKAYKEINKEKISIYSKEYMSNNADKIKIRNKEYHEKYKQNSEFLKKKITATKRWVAENRERFRDNQRARRARLRASGNVTSEIICKIFNSQKGFCANPVCKKILIKEKRNSFHLDHIVPVSRGGDNNFYNLQILCPQCNMNKSNKMPNEWAAEQGFLI